MSSQQCQSQSSSAAGSGAAITSVCTTAAFPETTDFSELQHPCTGTPYWLPADSLLPKWDRFSSQCQSKGRLPASTNTALPHPELQTGPQRRGLLTDETQPSSAPRHTQAPLGLHTQHLGKHLGRVLPKQALPVKMQRGPAGTRAHHGFLHILSHLCDDSTRTEQTGFRISPPQNLHRELAGSRATT